MRFADRQPTGDYADRYLGLADALEKLFQCRMDLVTEESIRNPYFRQEVEATRSASMNSHAKTLRFELELGWTCKLLLSSNSIARFRIVNYGPCMTTQDIAQAVMELPEKERLELARRIVNSLVVEEELSGKIAQAVGGIEDIVTGKVAGLTEVEFRNALK